MPFSSTSLPALLAAGMNETVHWFPEDVPLSRLAATLVGMANTRGGVVLLGVAPRLGEVQGLHDPESMMDRVFQAALLADPPLVLPLPLVVPSGASPVLWVTVPPGLPHVYSLDGRYLGREGRQTNPLSARRLRHLLLERGVVQFESQVPPGATLEDLDADKVGEYVAALGLSGNAPEEVLLRRGCVIKTADDSRRVNGSSPSTPVLRPTYAALLLFGKAPQQWLPGATLLAARFPGAALSDQFIKQEMRGTLPEQLRQAETFVRDQLRSVVRLVGLAHQEMPEYPFEAVRELLVNAVAHRDYNTQGDGVHLHIFADRLEVHSPGGLPGPVTLENLLEARFSRNAVIVQVLADLGFVERLGYGLDRVMTVMKQANLRPPRFEETAGTFRVTLFGPPPSSESTSLPDLSAYRRLNLNARQQMALNYIALHQRITNSEYQELCPEVHPETLRRDLADLVARNVLIKVGDRRATYYILK